MNSERLSIERPIKQDAQAYVNIRNSAYVLQYNPMRACDILGALDEFEKENMYLLKKEGTVLGAIFLNRDSLRFWEQSLELSFFMGEEFSGHGYMFEALSCMIDHIFTTTAKQIITIRVFAQNKRSIKLVETLGFHQDGFLRQCVFHQGILYDDILYSKKKEEWK